MKKFLKISALTLAMGLSQVAGANTYDINPGETYSFGENEQADFGNEVSSIESFDFSDVYRFDLSGFSSFDGTITTTFSIPKDEQYPATFMFESFEAGLYYDNDGDVNTSNDFIKIKNFDLSGTGTSKIDGVLPASFLSNDKIYAIVVSGKLGSNIETAQYEGMLTVSPVPEAEEWAMMMLGMGLIGLQLRRKNKMPNTSTIAI